MSLHALSDVDLKDATPYGNYRESSNYILREQEVARKTQQQWKASGLSSLLQLNRNLAKFESLVQDLCDATQENDSDNSDGIVVGLPIDTTSLWQLVYLNIKVFGAFHVVFPDT